MYLGGAMPGRLQGHSGQVLARTMKRDQNRYNFKTKTIHFAHLGILFIYVCFYTERAYVGEAAAADARDGGGHGAAGVRLAVRVGAAGTIVLAGHILVTTLTCSHRRGSYTEEKVVAAAWRRKRLQFNAALAF